MLSTCDSTLDLPFNLDTFEVSRARVTTPVTRAASASPDEIHKLLSLGGEKSFFNFANELLVNFQVETSDDTIKNGGGPNDGEGRTWNGGGGGKAESLVGLGKNRPGLRDQSSGIAV
jgi:hypothetical protein